MKNLNKTIAAALFFFLLALFCPAQLMSQNSTATQLSKAELCIKSYLEAFNSANNDLMLKFYQTYKSPQELDEESAEERADGISKAKKMIGNLTLDKMDIINEYEIEQVVRSSRLKRWFSIRIEMDSENPQYYSSITMMPRKSPSSQAKKEAKARKKTDPADYAKPQTPKPPYPYKEKLVEIVNSQDGTKLAGTLTLPKGKGKHPVVCLITGGSPFDRNQSLGDHHPFKVWADYLTREGYATLRIDDRGVGESEGDKMNSSYDVLSSDVLAAVSFLKKHRKIDTESIVLLGHSQGASIAVLTADKSKDINFVILLGSCGMTLLDNIAYQQADQSIGNEEINLAVSNHIHSLLLDKHSGENLDNAMISYCSKLEDEDKTLAEAYYNEIKQFLKMFSSMEMGRDALTFHQNLILERTQIPVKAITGSYDGLVINLPSMKRALEKANNSNFSVVEIENLNHMLQSVDSPDQGDPLVYIENEETVNTKVLEMVIDWLNMEVINK